MPAPNPIGGDPREIGGADGQAPAPEGKAPAPLVGDEVERLDQRRDRRLGRRPVVDVAPVRHEAAAHVDLIDGRAAHPPDGGEIGHGLVAQSFHRRVVDQPVADRHPPQRRGLAMADLGEAPRRRRAGHARG